MSTHTPEQIMQASQKHGRIVEFLGAALDGGTDLVVGARAKGRGRVCEYSIRCADAQPVLEHAMTELRAIEAEYGIERWVAPKGAQLQDAKGGSKKKTPSAC